VNSVLNLRVPRNAEKCIHDHLRMWFKELRNSTYTLQDKIFHSYTQLIFLLSCRSFHKVAGSRPDEVSECFQIT
jgi:hypothetical protein